MLAVYEGSRELCRVGLAFEGFYRVSEAFMYELMGLGHVR